jgi:hypothetical protein
MSFLLRGVRSGGLPGLAGNGDTIPPSSIDTRSVDRPKQKLLTQFTHATVRTIKGHIGADPDVVK